MLIRCSARDTKKHRISVKILHLLQKTRVQEELIFVPSSGSYIMLNQLNVLPNVFCDGVVDQMYLVMVLWRLSSQLDQNKVFEL